jgi:hypothetical protein
MGGEIGSILEELQRPEAVGILSSHSRSGPPEAGLDGELFSTQEKRPARHLVSFRRPIFFFRPGF